MQTANPESQVVEEPAPARWSFGPADAAIAAASLALVVGVSLPWAWSLRSQVRELDRQRAEADASLRSTRSTLEFLQHRRTARMQFRRAVDRYVAAIEARPGVPWSTAIGELSRRRPAGVWTTRLSGNGGRFRAEVAGSSPEALDAYAEALRQSPYVEYAAPVHGVAAKAELAGRWMGE
ncbi:MAG: hypothetical protein ACK47B_05985 [Armatimonadota bacterium]